MGQILIEHGTIVNRGTKTVGYLRISGQRIAEIGSGEYDKPFDGERIDAHGKFVLPGVIDDQVHFRDPGLTHKGDMHTESLAAVEGGVTSFMDMPNTVPATTTLELLEQKFERAAQVAVANYSFYLGATNDNISQIARVDPHSCCGIKLFMGSSTGNMLVDDPKTLAAIFDQSPILIATHCEDEARIKERTAMFRAKYPDNAPASIHALVRDAEACYRSSAKAVELADRYGSQLHVLHLSTARELSLFDNKPVDQKKITNEVCVHHLLLSEQDYEQRGNFIKWNPSIKGIADRDALRAGINSGKVDVVATDHAPHTLDEKMRPYWNAPSGGAMLQYSLGTMLELSRQGMWNIETVVEKMCHAPAKRYQIRERGFLDEGMYADIIIVDADCEHVVTREEVISKCGWSPIEGMKLHSDVVFTIINGVIVKRDKHIDTNFRGMPLEFR